MSSKAIQPLFSAKAIIAYFFLLKILLHLLHPEYGYFRDEMYYIAIADGFSFKNLEMLPLTPLYLKLILTIFGYSIKSIHFAASLLGAIALVFACLITKELGGKKYAILLTALFVDYYEALREQQFKSVYISIGIFKETLHNLFREVEEAGIFSHPYCVVLADPRLKTGSWVLTTYSRDQAFPQDFLIPYTDCSIPEGDSAYGYLFIIDAPYDVYYPIPTGRS